VDNDSRVDMLEHKVEKHSSQISKLFNQLENTNVKLDGIMHTLNQIRWTFYGAVGYYAISELGLMTTLKLMQ
tara:strand:+ start:496 stop:711 length:216 start_codon:yes stop_codon:yes gene_type:complete